MRDIEAAVSAVQADIEKDRDWVVKLTQEMVRIPSVNPKFLVDAAINREADVQALLESILKEAGFVTRQWDALPGRPNLIGDKAGEEARSLILCGHVDVVPVGEISRWTVEPFGGDIKDGKLYGRGAVDMKSGVAACVAAARAIHRCGIDLTGRLSMHSVVDEEAGGFGAIDIVRRGLLASAAIIAEPSWGDVQPAEGGLEWARVTIRGRTAHSAWRYNEIYPQRQDPGRFEPGVNAIELAARFVEALRVYESGRTRAQSHPLLPPGMNTINVGVIRGGAGLGDDGLPIVMTNHEVPAERKFRRLPARFRIFRASFRADRRLAARSPADDPVGARRPAFSPAQHAARSSAGDLAGEAQDGDRQGPGGSRHDRRHRRRPLCRRRRPRRHLRRDRRRFSWRRRICRCRFGGRDDQGAGRHDPRLLRRALSGPA
jgi:acetylornithine deacetylase/succinyl-diaminopimelate desuccinylase-like protein